MIQDIYPHKYDNTYFAESNKDGFAVVFSDESFLVRDVSGELELPMISSLGCNPSKSRYLFAIDDIPYYLVDKDDVTRTDGFRYEQFSAIRNMQPKHTVFAVYTAHSITGWYRGNRFCSKCGSEMHHKDDERALVCLSCGRMVFPTISPAVIVGLINGDRILVTRYSDRPFKNLALIAGYNEIGESIEDTVRREVKEETGLTVDKLLFYKSQPWPLSDTLLLGFYATAVSPAPIVIQESELSEAYWCSREDVPDDEGVSLTSEMMGLFKKGLEPRF